MHLEVTCPVCSGKQSHSLDSSGQSTTCGKCLSEYIIPSPGEPVSEFIANKTSQQKPSEHDQTALAKVASPESAVEDSAPIACEPTVATGISLIAIGCLQMVYSMFLFLRALMGGLTTAFEAGAFLFLSGIAAVPDAKTLFSKTHDPYDAVTLPVLIFGTILSIAAIGSGFQVCSNNSAGKTAALVVAVLTVPLCLLHVVQDLALIGLLYGATSVIAIKVTFSPSQNSLRDAR